MYAVGLSILFGELFIVNVMTSPEQFLSVAFRFWQYPPTTILTFFLGRCISCNLTTYIRMRTVLYDTKFEYLESLTLPAVFNTSHSAVYPNAACL